MNINIIKHTLIALGLAVVFIAMPKAHAAGRGIDRATGQAIWDAATAGKTTTLGIGTGAMRIVGPAGATTAIAGGGAKVTGTGVAEVGGVRVPIGISGEVAKDAIAGAVAGCLTGGIAGCVLGTLTPLAIAYATSSGTRINPDNGTVEMQDPSICTTAPCYYFYYASVRYDSQTLACKAYAAAQNASDPSQVTTATAATNGDHGSCFESSKRNSDGNWIRAPANRSVGIFEIGTTHPPASPTWYPADAQAVRDALYNNDPPPAIVDELSKYGNIIWPLGNVKVTGPAEVTGPKEVSSTKSGDKTTTTTSQSKTPLSYDGPSVTAGTTTKTTTSTTTTTNPDGSTSTTTGDTTTTTTESGTEPTKDPEEAPTDTPLPDLPKLYQRKYPDGIVGIWNTKSEQIKQAPLLHVASDLMPNVGSGGSCPTFTIPLDFAQWASYGSSDVSPPCWIWDFGKAVVIVSAMLLARALVFGG